MSNFPAIDRGIEKISQCNVKIIYVYMLKSINEKKGPNLEAQTEHPLPIKWAIE